MTAVCKTRQLNAASRAKLSSPEDCDAQFHTLDAGHRALSDLPPSAEMGARSVDGNVRMRSLRSVFGFRQRSAFITQGCSHTRRWGQRPRCAPEAVTENDDAIPHTDCGKDASSSSRYSERDLDAELSAAECFRVSSGRSVLAAVA